MNRLPLVFIAAGLTALAACSQSPPASRSDRAAAAACRSRAEAIFNQRNRSDQYRSDGNFGTPYSGTTLPTNPSAGLSQRYDYDDIVSRCMNGSEANTEGPAGPRPANLPPVNATRPANAEPLSEPAPGAPLTAPPNLGK